MFPLTKKDTKEKREKWKNGKYGEMSLLWIWGWKMRWVIRSLQISRVKWMTRLKYFFHLTDTVMPTFLLRLPTGMLSMQSWCCNLSIFLLMISTLPLYLVANKLQTLYVRMLRQRPSTHSLQLENLRNGHKEIMQGHQVFYVCKGAWKWYTTFEYLIRKSKKCIANRVAIDVILHTYVQAMAWKMATTWI